MILNDAAISPAVISSVVGYLAQRSNVCAKLIDREGTILAVNRRGLELIGMDSEQVCGQVWLEFWTGSHRDAAQSLLAAAFGGRSESFAATVPDGDGLATWEVEGFPCDWQDGEVTKVLVLSTRAATGTTAEDAGVIRAMRDTLHAFANLSAAAVSAANLLRRGVDEERAQLLAVSLESVGRDASDRMAQLKSHFPNG